jgi:hypothetical protein
MGMKKDSGTAGVNYPTVPLLLGHKPKRNNILIGNDPAQIRFAEQYLSMEHGIPVRVEAVPLVEDKMLLGHDDHKLYLVDVSSQIDISDKEKSKTGIFELNLMDRGSSGLNAIVRHAAKLLDMPKPTKDVVSYVGYELIKETDSSKKYMLGDIRAAVWFAAWLLRGPVPPKINWTQPWENWLMWMPRGFDPYYRLNALYRELVMWVFASAGDDAGFRKTGGSWNAKRWQKLAQLQLPKDKVYATLAELSAWKAHSYDPYVCVIRISKIWGPGR